MPLIDESAARISGKNIGRRLAKKSTNSGPLSFPERMISRQSAGVKNITSFNYYLFLLKFFSNPFAKNI
jgi:hypothetical protein